MKDKLRREFSLGVCSGKLCSPSLCIVKTNIYRVVKCVKNVLSRMFMENTWQVFAINASCKCWEWKPVGKKCLRCVWEPASIAKEYALHIPTMLYSSPCCYLKEGPESPLLGLGDWGRGGATCQGLQVQNPSWSQEREAYSYFLGSDAPIGYFSFVHIGQQLWF